MSFTLDGRKAWRVAGTGLFLFTSVLAALASLSAGAQESVPTLPPITRLEAMHLVADQVRGLAVEKVAFAREDGGARYTVEGQADGEAVMAIVDANVARVISVDRGGRRAYTWGGITAVGHRGTVTFGPENTIAGYLEAIERGADLVEMDVRETKDGHLVIMHDSSVARTTDGRGAVAALTLKAIKKLDAGAWFDPAFAGERVPTFKEALVAIRGRALPDVDFKAGSPEKVAAVLKEEGIAKQVTVYCGDWGRLKKLKSLLPGIKIRPTVPLGHAGLSIVLQETNPPIVNMDWWQVTERLIRDTHLAGRKAFVNTMGANDDAYGLTLAIDAGADYIQTDRLDILLPLLRERGLHE